MTEDPSPLVRLGAAFALGQLLCSRSIDILTQRLASEYDPDIRQQIVLSLGQVGHLKTLRLLDEQFRVLIPDETLFKAYVYFFSRSIIRSECIGFCCESLSSKNANNRRMAAAALLRIRNSELLAPHIKPLIDAIKNPDPEIRRSVAKVLRLIPFSKKDQMYSDLLTDPDWRVRYESVLAIPGLQNRESLWMEALDDSSNHVVAAALQNAPGDIVLNQHLINKLTRLFKNSSEHIRGSIVQFATPFLDSSNQLPVDFFPADEALLPYKVAGLNNSPNRQSFDSLLNLSKHRIKPIATPAYLGIINMLDSLIANNIITIGEYKAVLIDGLTGNDPVQVYHAASIISETDLKMTDMAPFLYECLKKHNQYAFLEACVAVLSAIEKIRPDGTVDHLKPLLSNKQKQIRDKSRHILTEIYGENVVTPTDYNDVFVYSRLTKLNQYGLCPRVQILTNRGTFVIECDGFYAPYTVAAFLDRIDSGFYDGLIFHRVIPNFVVQGGDPRGDGWGGPNYHLLTEKSPVGYNIGSVGMASAGPDTEGSQFFITTTSQYHLDYNYTRFGRVVEGLDVVLNIERGDKILAADARRPSN